MFYAIILKKNCKPLPVELDKFILEMIRQMATHSSVPAWRIPETGEPGGLPYMGLHRLGPDWSALAAAAWLNNTHKIHRAIQTRKTKQKTKQIYKKN